MKNTINILLFNSLFVFLLILSACSSFHKVNRNECYHRDRDILGSYKRDTSQVANLLPNMPRLEIITIRSFHKVEAKFIGGLGDGGPIMVEGERTGSYSVDKGYWYVKGEQLYIKINGHKETLQFDFTTQQIKELNSNSSVYLKL